MGLSPKQLPKEITYNSTDRQHARKDSHDTSLKWSHRWRSSFDHREPVKETLSEFEEPNNFVIIGAHLVERLAVF